jgi:hypothetical protein
MQSTLPEVKSASDIFPTKMASHQRTSTQVPQMGMGQQNRLHCILLRLLQIHGLIQKQLFHRTHAVYQSDSMGIWLTEDVIDEVKKDAEIYVKTKLIVSKYSVLRKDNFESMHRNKP